LLHQFSRARQILHRLKPVQDDDMSHLGIGRRFTADSASSPITIAPMPTFPANFVAVPEDAGKRLDQYLVAQLGDVSRARVQQLIEEGKVVVNDQHAKPSFKLRGGERIGVLGPAQAAPLRATPEDIPLDIVYEDDDLAVINKPAGMMVHAGAGATEDARNQGTLVNALVHRFGNLSKLGGELRPGIVHRLDKATSGLIVVAKNDEAHRKVAAQFAQRRAKKTYIALAHGWLKQDRGTIRSNISRDRIRRTRMTTRRPGGREAVTHYQVRRKLDTPFGKFTLLELKIDTGRTHQIRVHLASLGHPVVGDTVYGAPREIHRRRGQPPLENAGTHLSLPRNFLHATSLEIVHPRSAETLSFSRPLPPELQQFLERLEQR
jgi:23S rRNA pseudouridine1911/1915/1917 synthase